MRLLGIWISFKSAKKTIVIFHLQNQILKQITVTGSGFERTPKLLKAFFSRLFLCQNYETLEVPTRVVYVHWFEIWQFYS